MENTAYYSAFKAKDTRFDGRFFVGISSTGIYCRPVCRAKLPKPENCTFYESAAEAEKAGYRPCLLCRPELAPGIKLPDAENSLACRAAKILEDNFSTEHSLKQVSERLGCTDRHLRRVFMAEYNVSPLQYLQTRRLLLAKNLLSDTTLSVLEIALISGFGSLRRFNETFKKQYRLTPTMLRRESLRKTKSDHDTITLTLGYRPPYQWEPMLDFLALRAIPGVELIRDGAYMRVVHIMTEKHEHIYGWICIRHLPQRNALSVTIKTTLLPVLSQILARIRHLFDLHCDPDAIYEILASMNSIHPGFCIAGLRLPGCFDTFEMMVRAVLGQQISVKAARTLAERLVVSFGKPVETGIEGLTHSFPSAADLIALDKPIRDCLGPLGVTGKRADAILELARLCIRDQSELSSYIEPEQVIQKLQNISGIGEWTARYIAMRALSAPDTFLHTDYGVKKALSPRTSQEILALAESWHPWRSYATMNLWNSL